MLRDFGLHSASAVNHYRDFRHSSHIYRVPSCTDYDRSYYAHPTLTPRAACNSPIPPLTNVGCRARGGDGRFVARAEIVTSDIPDGKVCGWCRTTVTSQWRVGPTTGSIEMGTLCNACGINYRRALTKTATGKLNLDSLAQSAGHPTARPSIQKALKRVRKQGAARRTRTTGLTVSNERVAVAALVDHVSPHNRSTFANTTFQRSNSSTSRSGNSLVANSIASSPASLSFPSPPSPSQSLISSRLPPPPAPPPETASSSHLSSTASTSARQCARLPPFQSFIGQLKGRAFM